MCTKPIRGWRTARGTIKPNPLAARLPTENSMEVSCGRCIECRLERSRIWAVRCMHEMQFHERSSFLTLTLSEMPPGESLYVEHLQKFYKRLRYYVGKVRHFSCGEYGEENGRPHYHAILFGTAFDEDRKFLKNSKSKPLYVSPTLTKAWGMGHAYIGEANFETAAYVARYITKKLDGEKGAEAYGSKKPPFVVMSRNPGIGKDWVKRYHADTYRDDNVIARGFPSRPPKYYDAYYNRYDEEEMQAIKERRLEKYATVKSDEKLKARDTVMKARTNIYKRDVDGH